MTPYYDRAGIISLIDFDIDSEIVAKQLSADIKIAAKQLSQEVM